MMLRRITFVSLAGGLLASAATAQAPSRADQLVAYRKAMYTVMYNNFATVAGMATGRMPFDAQLAQSRAERVEYLSRMIPEGFPADSASGKPTKAKPEIWTQRAEFDRLMSAWQKTATELVAATRSGDLEKVKTAFKATSDACKACHDRYRID